MNILIVDDNKNNRMILQLLLEDYAEENERVSFNIQEAVDGIQAVEMCSNGSFDIVLMDIMMPNMDGIEATKIIRQSDKKIMIIAVSAVDDSDRKKLILNNGAEDYIAKPVNADIFISRMENYITLVEGRKAKKTSLGHASNPDVSHYNTYTSDIFSRYTRFMVSSEDTLAEFWEFYLLNSEAKCDNLSDVVRTVFSIAEAQNRLSIHGDIYVEESDDFKYFTITKIDDLPVKIIELIIKKSSVDLDYKIDADKVTFRLELIYSEEPENIATPAVVAPIVEETKTVANEVEPSSSIQFEQSQELMIFDYIDHDDLYDLEEYAGKLNSLMLIVGSGDVSEDEVVEIYSNLEKLGSILSTYSEVYPISQALSQLSSDMSTHIEEFSQNSEALGPMCKAFSNDMSNWIEKSFHTGAPSADFMNDTIIVNCQTIGSMLKMDEVHSGDDDFDDIFDF